MLYYYLSHLHPRRLLTSIAGVLVRARRPEVS
jgi:hypothetical protein